MREGKGARVVVIGLVGRRQAEAGRFYQDGGGGAEARAARGGASRDGDLGQTGQTLGDAGRVAPLVVHAQGLLVEGGGLRERGGVKGDVPEVVQRVRDAGARAQILVEAQMFSL